MEQCTDLVHVVPHGEPRPGPPLPGGAPSPREIRTIDQQGHGLGHPMAVAFCHQPPRLLIHNHIRNPAMAGSHNGQTAKLSFHHGDRASLFIPILRRAGMLHKHPRTTHLLGHRIG